MRKQLGMRYALVGLSSFLLSLVANAQVVSTLAGSGTAGGADGAGAAASFNLPSGVALDGSGNVYVSDFGNEKIRKISADGVVTTFAGSGIAGGADGTGTAASFRSPLGIAVDGAGNVYVADELNNKIRKITPSGAVSTFAGSGSQGSLDGPGTVATFYWPFGVDVDGNGNVFVAEYKNNKIRKITPDGVVTTLAGSGVTGSEDGVGTAAAFNSPTGVAVEGSGIVYIADQYNNEIRRISAGAIVTTFAGSGIAGSADGTGTTASFHQPLDAAVDGAGNVYVADFANNKIRKITAGGAVTTLAGSGVQGSADGTGAAASFKLPESLAVDASGNIFVADTFNNRIRKITQSGSGCVQNASAACLIGGRYKVTSHWQNQYAGGRLSTLSASRLTDTTAAFWLADGGTFEYMIRISVATDNGRAWIAIPTFTDVEFWIEVVDTTSGQYHEYHSPAGNKTLIYDPFFFVYP